MRSQVFIYGSCVARDILRVVPGRFGLVHYAARQSWISAASKSLEPPRQIDLSPFSARSLRGDFSSNLPYLIRKKAKVSDVILVDLASDRHGVYPVKDSYLSNTGELKRSRALSAMEHGDLIEFGSREHKLLFKQSVSKLKRVMVKAGVFDRVLIINIRFAGQSDNGERVPLARGKTSAEVNSDYEYYYRVLERYGFTLTEVPPAELQIAASQHKWGLQQDHFIDPLYYWWADRIDDFVSMKNSD